MIKLGMQGLPEEVKDSVEQLKKVFNILELSTPRKDSTGKYVIIYANVERKSAPTLKELLRTRTYLEGLSEETVRWVVDIVQTEGLNLYHSVASVIQGKGRTYGYNEMLNYYIEKNIPKRSYLVGNEDKIKELFKHVYKRLQEKYC